jgi:hypothetical protein
MARVLLWALCAAAAQAQSAYVGDAACARCHAAQARAFAKTPMGKAISSAKPEDVPRAVKVGGRGGVEYVAAVRNGRVYHESTRGGKLLESHEVVYTIGSGEHGRSYIVSRGAAFFESPISYYAAKSAWDLSPGYAEGYFRDFTRPVTTECLSCHMAQPTAITCERCHGPADRHVKSPSAGTIVNPAKLSPELRDDVCYQCHLGGDIRILKPRKAETDFRPGAPLEDVVSIFSMPPATKPEGLDAVGQAGQLRLSRCWKASSGKLGCITCHDPHRAPQYRAVCLGCHETRPCTANNCISCHMPRNPLNRVAHIAHTNHRILRFEEDALDPSPSMADGLEPNYEGRGNPDPRSKALAYAQAAAGLPMLKDRAVRLLQTAAAANPDDLDIAEALGLTTRSQPALERAVALGSKSAEVRIALSDLLAASGDLDAGRRVASEAARLSPSDPAALVHLARLCLRSGDATGAASAVKQLRELDPANPALPELER